MRGRRCEARQGHVLSAERQAEEERSGVVLLDRLPLEVGPQPHPEEGHGRQAPGEHDGREGHALRHEAHDLRRLQGDGGPVKTLKIAAVIVVLAIAGVLGFAALQPDSFSVRRAASIKAPPEKIFPLINDFSRWGAWSPYEKKDPAMKRSFSGPAAGKGAVYAWEGNQDVGQGRMEIADAAAPSRVSLKLDFVKP